MTFNGDGGNYPTQGTSQAPASPLKRFKNWNYCHTHGGNIHNTHTSATCAQPGENHQRAATRSNTMDGNNKGLHKTILLSAVGQRPPAAPPPLPPTNYTPTFLMPFGNNGPWFPTAPSSWGFGPHAAAYLPTRQQHSSSPTRNVHDRKYHGNQQWVQLPWHHACIGSTYCVRSTSACSTVILPEPLLKVRGSQCHT